MNRIYADYSDDFLAKALKSIGGLIGNLKADRMDSPTATRAAELSEQIEAVTEVYNLLAEEQNRRILEAFVI